MKPTSPGLRDSFYHLEVNYHELGLTEPDTSWRKGDRGLSRDAYQYRKFRENLQNHMKMKMPSVTVEVAARDLEAERNKMGLTMNLWFEQVVLKRGKRSKKKKQQPPEARAEGNDEESGQDDEGDE